MKNTTPTSIRLDPEVYRKVVEEAQKEDRSISAQINWIIKKYYEIKKTIN